MYWQSSIIVLAVILGSSVCLNRRFKRVINGVALKGRPTTYTAIRYYGVTSTARASPILRKFLAAFGEHGDVHCSGSLITPKIFHTACHCVSSFDINVKDFVKPVFVDHKWENSRTIFFGVSEKYGEESMETYYPVLSEKFILHQKCASLGSIYTFDYAIIQIPYEWIKVDDRSPYPWTEIEYAPLYSITEIRDFFMYALRKQLVCLNVGFGAYIPGTTGPKSDFLRTGWGVLMPHKSCFKATAGSTPSNLFSWMCSDPFPHHNQRVGKADSGGPITCDNRYFAIVLGYYRGSMISPLYYDLFISAIEYREDLIHSVDELTDTYRSIDLADFHKTSARVRPRPGFVLKMLDTNGQHTKAMNIQKTKVPLLSSKGFNCFVNSLTLSIVICIHMLL